MLFYTGKGDSGESHIGNTKIDKTCLDIEVLGNLDELNSFLGLTRNQHIQEEHSSIIRQVQEDLFIIQAYVASIMIGGHEPPTFPQEKTTILEDHIARIEAQVQPEPKFVVPGETKQSAWLDVTRTLARKTEVAMLRLNKEKKLEPTILSYLNRLSSLLYALARAEVKKADKQESHPQYQ